MKYLSPRQMWHDAFYQRSANDALLELQRSDANILRRKPVMNETQTRGPADNGRKVMHMVMAGKVQSKIAKLPEHLQAFGNYCWAPRTQSHPTFKDQHKYMQLVLERVKHHYPELYARNTSAMSIVIMQTFKYEFDRAHGRKPQSLDIIIANALNKPKAKIRSTWGDAIKLIRAQVRDLNLDADCNRDLDISAAVLLEEYKKQGGKGLGYRGPRLAKLALKSFAHQDQVNLFSSGEEKESTQPSKPLYTQEYLGWVIDVKQHSFNQQGYKGAFELMMRVCERWAEKVLELLRLQSKP